VVGVVDEAGAAVDGRHRGGSLDGEAGDAAVDVRPARRRAGEDRREQGVNTSLALKQA